MKTHLNNMLYKIAEHTLSSLAFLFCIRGEGEIRISPENSTTMAAVFKGPISGVLNVTVENSVMPVIAVNMLGVDDCEVISREQQIDALGETLNVICGNLLPEVGGKEAVFEIGPPRVTDDIASPRTEPEKVLQARVSFELDEGNCQLLLYTDTELEDTAREE